MPATSEAVSQARVPPVASALHRRRDRVCMIVFVAVLVSMGLAAFRPRAVATLEAENRTMAAWPSGSSTRGFAPAFEQAFADRFGGREVLLRFHNRAQVRLFGVHLCHGTSESTDDAVFFQR